MTVVTWFNGYPGLTPQLISVIPHFRFYFPHSASPHFTQYADVVFINTNQGVGKLGRCKLGLGKLGLGKLGWGKLGRDFLTGGKLGQGYVAILKYCIPYVG